MKVNRWRRGLAASLVLALGPIAAACGDDGEDGAAATEESGATDDGGETSGAAASVEDVQACLEGEGWKVERGSSAPPALQEAMGLVDFLGITVAGDSVGIGDVTFYEDEGAAEEGVESAELVRTEEVVIERVGTVVYTYVGSGDAASRIGGCI